MRFANYYHTIPSLDSLLAPAAAPPRTFPQLDSSRSTCLAHLLLLQKMLRAALLLAIGARADFIQTNFYLSSARCGGQVFQSVAQLAGCTVSGATASLRVTCVNDTAATADVFSTLDCTGPSQPIDVPFPSTCAAVAQGGSSQTKCKTGPYSACRRALANSPRTPSSSLRPPPALLTPPRHAHTHTLAQLTLSPWQWH
jgi:hypothetical protein